MGDQTNLGEGVGCTSLTRLSTTTALGVNVGFFLIRIFMANPRLFLSFHVLPLFVFFFSLDFSITAGCTEVEVAPKVTKQLCKEIHNIDSSSQYKCLYYIRTKIFLLYVFHEVTQTVNKFIFGIY